MSPDEVNAILDNILEMTRQMQAFAQQENWVEVAKLEDARQKTLRENFSDSITGKPADIHKKIQQVIEIDGKIQELAGKAKSDIRDEVIELNNCCCHSMAYHAK